VFSCVTLQCLWVCLCVCQRVNSSTVRDIIAKISAHRATVKMGSEVKRLKVTWVGVGVEFNAPPDTVHVISEAVTGG